MTRICKKCEIPKELNLNNFRENRLLTGLRKTCKACSQRSHYLWGKIRPQKDMLYKARNRAKTLGLPFDITEKDIVIPELCPIFGHKLEVGTREFHEWAPTIDRIQPKLGYVKSNIHVISYRANRIKNNSTLYELKQLVAFLETQPH